MSDQTKIEWCDSTFNPWIGCTRVSPGCEHCYAETMAARYGYAKWGPKADRRRTSDAYWKQPIKWNKNHERFFDEHGHRQRVFCASMADVFDEAAQRMWRADLWALIEATPNLDWLLLTKRPENFHDMLPWNWRDGYPNVKLGVSVENQTEADRRIPPLMRIPCVVRFLSIEPMLGPVSLLSVKYLWQKGADGYDAYMIQDVLSGYGTVYDGSAYIAMYSPTHIDWVICGGESGPGARPMHPDWAYSLRDQCAAAGVPFHFKQWGEWVTTENREFGRGPGQLRGMRSDGTLWDEYPPDENADCITVKRVGKARAGRVLAGRTHDEFPLTRMVK